MDAVQIYRAYVTAILVVFVGLGAAGFAKSDPAAMVVPQIGTVIEGTTPLDSFNEDALIDTSQVEGR